jgi:thioredoxin-like negative regulator of GroEL
MVLAAGRMVQCPRPARVPRSRTWLLAAASIAALLGIAWVVRDRTALDPTTATVTEPRLPVAQLRGAVRSLGITAADSHIVAGLDAYNRGDLAAARRAFETAGRAGRMEAVRRIYLASTLLELGDAAGAAAALHDVELKWVPEPWKSEARWTLATALARTGRRAAADSLFDVLARETGPVGDRARAQRATGSAR